MLFGDASPERLVASIVALLVGLTFHEFSHAYTADQLGDHRPRAMGRVTLNPIAHLDPIGAILLLVAGFGWAKPVMVNTYALRNGRIGMAMVAVAGPLANIALAIGFAVAYRLIVGDEFPADFVGRLVYFIVAINVLLAFFNILPIPPLDGYNVALAFLPPRMAFTLQRYAPYGAIVLLVLVLLPQSPLDLLFRLAGSISRLLIGA